MPDEPVILATDVQAGRLGAMTPQFGPGSQLNWDDDKSDPNKRANDVVTEPQPEFGPGSKVNWDNEKNDPNRRKHVGIDPKGVHNVKMA